MSDHDGNNRAEQQFDLIMLMRESLQSMSRQLGIQRERLDSICRLQEQTTNVLLLLVQDLAAIKAAAGIGDEE